MPANDDPPPPPRRRALGRGPGATRPPGPPGPGEGDPLTPPRHPETGGEPSGPAKVSGGPDAVQGEAEERQTHAPDCGGAGPDTAGTGVPEVDSAIPPLPEAGGEPPDPPRRALPDDGRGPGASGAGSPEQATHAPGGAEGDVQDPASPGAPETATHAPRGGAGDAATTPDDAGAPGALRAEAGAAEGGFRVRLVNFEGPFDLLLQLISKHKLDVTEVALSKVTDEFMAYIRAMGPDWDLDQTTEFLVVAATLLDLKAARLLPAAEVEDEADLALLEARDLLFARLLQYRAYKQIADIFDRRLDDEARRFPRTVGLEPHLAELLPEVVISIGAEGFAKLAVKAMQPRPKPQVYVDHIHAPLVSVREQAEVVVAMLKARGRASFRELTEGAADTLTVVARFLALLELYREKAVALDQEDALGELTVIWAAGAVGAVTVTDEFDQVVEEKR